MFCPLALSWKGSVSLTTGWAFALLAEGSSQSLVEHSVVGGRALFRLCAGYSAGTGGHLPVAIAMAHPIN